MSESTKSIYIAWVQYQRRIDSMKSLFGYDVVYVPPLSGNKIKKAISYARQSWITFRTIMNLQPKVVWFQSPPTIAIYAVFLAKFFTRNEFKVVADLHNAALRSPWNRFPLVRRLLQSCELVIVHNQDVGSNNLEYLKKTNWLVLEDPPGKVVDNEIDYISPYILVPCSFNADEPILDLLDCARLCPNLRFLVTGNKDKAFAKGFVQAAPDNVEFVGFLPIEEYDQLLVRASLVVGLTTLSDVQLSVASEALGAGRALLLSDTPLLRKMFCEAAVFSKNSASSLAEKIQGALDIREELEGKSLALAEAKFQTWVRKANTVAGLLAQKMS